MKPQRRRLRRCGPRTHTCHAPTGSRSRTGLPLVGPERHGGCHPCRSIRSANSASDGTTTSAPFTVTIDLQWCGDGVVNGQSIYAEVCDGDEGYVPEGAMCDDECKPIMDCGGDVDVSSSNFPRFDVNPNTGAPEGDDGPRQKATNRVHLGGVHASHVLLPVVPTQAGG